MSTLFSFAPAFNSFLGEMKYQLLELSGARFKTGGHYKYYLKL